VLAMLSAISLFTQNEQH